MRLKDFRKYIGIGIAILTVVILASNLVGAAAKGNDAIGYVDMEKLQSEMPEFLQLQDIKKDKETELNYYRGYLYQQHQTAIKELEAKAKAEKTGKSTAEQAAIDKRLQDDEAKKADELNNLMQQKLAEIQKAFDQQQKDVEEKVNKLIATVAEEKKITLVLDKRARFYGGTDLTEDVISKAKKQTETSKTEKDEQKTKNK